jgi:hypothetical protein
MYCYTLEVLNVANKMTRLDDKAERIIGEAGDMRKDIDAALSGINEIASIEDIKDILSSGESAINRATRWGEEIADDPKAVIQQLASYGLSELKNKMFEEMARPLIGRYLSNGSMDGDTYLRSVGVCNRIDGTRGLEALDLYKFSLLGEQESVLIDKDGNVKLVAQYHVEYTFGSLKLPFSPTLKIRQTAVTKAWLNGSGKGYW